MPLVSTSYLSFIPNGVFFWVVKRKAGALQHLISMALRKDQEGAAVTQRSRLCVNPSAHNC